MRRFALSVAFLASLAGCSKAAPPPEDVSELEQPIVGGSVDNGNDATVFVLFGNQGACSGTIIQKDVPTQTAYVLTAAHCWASGNPTSVRQADNLANGYTEYPVINYATHPSYNVMSNVFDFGIIRIGGASNGTPTVPVPTPAQDTAGSGDQVELSGYGKTNAANMSGSTQRMHVNVGLSGCANFGLGANADNFFICYDQGNASGVGVGACSGDSGGPAYMTIGGTNYVVGVTSFGDGACNDFGVSGRASVATDFINTFITGQGGGTLSCDQCFGASTNGMGVCTGAVNACFGNASCNALNDCLSACAPADQACQQQCVSQNQAGLALFQAIFTCVCETGCATECAGDPSCAPGPACGFTSQDATCQTCFENSCCAEATACSDDVTCTNCVTDSTPPASCSQNALVNDFFGCLQDNCSQQCGIMGGGGSGGAGGSGTGGSGTGGSGTGGSGTGGSGTGGSGTAGSGGGTAGGPNGGAGGDGTGGSGSGADGTQNNGSCGCSVPTEDPARGAWAGLGLLGLLVLRGRRKKAA